MKNWWELLTGDDGVGFLGIKYSSKVGLLSEFNHQDKLFIGHLTETQESKSFFYSSASSSFSH